MWWVGHWHAHGVARWRGAILAIPLFVYGLHMEHAQAVVASLAVVAVGAVFGGATHLRQGHVMVTRGVTFGALGIIGSGVATAVSHRVSGDHFMLYFAALLLLVAGLMLRGAWKSRRFSSDATSLENALLAKSRWIPDRPILFLVSAIAVGFLTGFLAWAADSSSCLR